MTINHFLMPGLSHVTCQRSDVSCKGFTLIEILLSVALIALIVGLGAPVYQSLQVRNDLDIAVNTVAQTAHRAQLLSQAVDGDMSWGVNLQTGKISLFQGTSYATRDSSWDEDFSMPDNIVISGITEIVFNKFSGETQDTGTISLTSVNGDTREISINNKGIIEY